MGTLETIVFFALLGASVISLLISFYFPAGKKRLAAGIFMIVFFLAALCYLEICYIKPPLTSSLTDFRKALF